MNKKKFQNLIKSPGRISESELTQLEELQKSYPFSQVIHAVAAKSHMKSRSTAAQQKLGHAAIYSTNRRVLKKFIEGEFETLAAEKVVGKLKTSEPQKTEKPESKPGKPQEDKKETVKPKSEKEKAVKDSPEVKKTAPVKEITTKSPTKQLEDKKSVEPVQKRPKELPKTSTESVDEMDKIRSEVFAGIKSLEEKMQLLKDEPEAPVKKKITRKTSSTRKTSNKKSSAKTAASKTTTKKSTSKKSTSKPASKTTTSKAKTKSTTTKKDTASGKKKLKTSPPENDILDQIHSMEEKELGVKQQQQNQLIENFVQREPKPKQNAAQDSEQEVADLARESVHFNEELISENLAVIFAKQGKTDKAVEIYKKLIWKYPQKKSYFATQIEGLEKK